MPDLYQIFGRTTRLIFDDSVAASVLAEELTLYPQEPPGSAPVLDIHYGAVPVPAAGLINPSLHYELKDGFLTEFRRATARWYFQEQRLVRVDFDLRRARTTGLRSHAQRMLSNQFTTKDEAVGQAFHELILIPSLYFDSTRLLVHASGLQDPDGGVTLIGGTGGVGKTSMELDLCRLHGYKFVADDIAVLDGRGHVWPNLAFPKIYGYNLQGDDALREVLLRGRSWGDRLNWRLHGLRGPQHVRRRVSPARLYPAYSSTGGPLRRYIFISREVRDDISVEEASSALLAHLSITVMDAEYHLFHNHLAWHRLNRLLMGDDPITGREEVLGRWRTQLTALLANVECTIVRAPRKMDHRDFRRRMADIISNGPGAG